MIVSQTPILFLWRLPVLCIQMLHPYNALNSSPLLPYFSYHIIVLFVYSIEHVIFLRRPFYLCTKLRQSPGRFCGRETCNLFERFALRKKAGGYQSAGFGLGVTCWSGITNLNQHTKNFFVSPIENIVLLRRSFYLCTKPRRSPDRHCGCKTCS